MKSRLYSGITLQRIHNVRRALLTATAMFLVATAAPSFAHDPGEYRGSFNHFYDHLEHQQFHQQFNDERNAANSWGSGNPQQHEDWHPAYVGTLEKFPNDH